MFNASCIMSFRTAKFDYDTKHTPNMHMSTVGISDTKYRR